MISVGGVPPTVWGDLTVTPHIRPYTSHIDDKRRAIKIAMAFAVLAADDGELIVQRDIDVTDDPRRLPPTPGKVRMLNEPVSHKHQCPRAFIIYDRPTRLAVAEAWLQPSMRACVAWADIPKDYSVCTAVHLG